MNSKQFSFSLISFFLAALMIAASSAQRTVGVQVGDWYLYGEVTSEWTSNDPNADPPLGYEWWDELIDVEWMNMIVEEVSDTNVTLQTIVHFNNGSEETSGGYVDVDTGEGENMSTMIISSGLEANDAIYSSPEYSTSKINETIARTYPGGSRETNHINNTMDFWIYGGHYIISINYYWDKVTGVLVEMSMLYQNQTGEFLSTWTVSFRIIDSNSWVIPEFPNWIPLLVLTLATCTVAIYRHGRKRLIH